MSDPTPALPTNQLERAATTYEDARVVITPEAPRHYDLNVSASDGEITEHAVERVLVNTTEVRLGGPIWFVDVKLDVGIPVDDHGDTVWVWP